MQVIFVDPKGKRVVLNARDASAVAHLVLTKHADGWHLADENPPVVKAAANDVAFATSGDFLDPRGHVMTLRATTPSDFRILVTRKLAAGWRRIESSPKVAPLKNETQVALGPPEAAKPVVLAPLAVSAEERNAAIAAAQAGTLNTALMSRDYMDPDDIPDVGGYPKKTDE
jgi:hypothetical protein